MSKNAEQKALEIVKQYDYPWDTGSIFQGYTKGYNQAMQDFLDKACEWLIKHNRGQLVTQFKNYMENEIQD